MMNAEHLQEQNPSVVPEPTTSKLGLDDEITVTSDIESGGTLTAAYTPKPSSQHAKRTTILAAVVLLVLLGVGVALGVVFANINKNSNTDTASATAASRTYDADSTTMNDADSTTMNDYVSVDVTPVQEDSVTIKTVIEDTETVIEETASEQLEPAQVVVEQRSLAAAFDELARGEYVTDQLVDYFFVTISAAANAPSDKLLHMRYPYEGYTPASAARIFDTANPFGDGGWSDGDYHLGSPHFSCGGPGHGEAGAKGSDYENCTPLGNVLIIQESDKETPDDYCGGGNLTFTFEAPVAMQSITLFSITWDQTATIKVTDAFGALTEKATPDCLGSNGVYTMPVEVGQVTKVEVSFSASGAVADLQYQA